MLRDSPSVCRIWGALCSQFLSEAEKNPLKNGIPFVLWVGRENPVIFSGNIAVTVGHSRDCPQHYMNFS